MLSHRSSSQTAADLPSSPPTPQTRSCPQCRVLMTSNQHHQAETVRPRPGRPRVTLTKTPDGGLSPIPPSGDSRLTLDNLLCSQTTSRKSTSTLISQKHSNATSETAGAGLAINRKRRRRAERQHERASVLKPGLDLRDLQEVWRMEDIFPPPISAETNITGTSGGRGQDLELWWRLITGSRDHCYGWPIYWCAWTHTSSLSDLRAWRPSRRLGLPVYLQVGAAALPAEPCKHAKVAPQTFSCPLF